MTLEDRVRKLEIWVQDAEGRALADRVNKLEGKQSVLELLVERLAAFLPFGS